MSWFVALLGLTFLGLGTLALVPYAWRGVVFLAPASVNIRKGCRRLFLVCASVMVLMGAGLGPLVLSVPTLPDGFIPSNTLKECAINLSDVDLNDVKRVPPPPGYKLTPADIAEMDKIVEGVAKEEVRQRACAEAASAYVRRHNLTAYAECAGIGGGFTVLVVFALWLGYLVSRWIVRGFREETV